MRGLSYIMICSLVYIAQKAAVRGLRAPLPRHIRTRARGLGATSEFYDKGVTTGLASDTIFALSSGPMTKTGVARKKRIPTF